MTTHFKSFMALILAGWPLAAANYELPATPATVVWGYYSAKAKPAITVHSGDSVRMHTVSTCSLEKMEALGVPHDAIPQYDRDIHEQVKERGPGGHILTGPVEIAEAEPGDVLEVQILKIELDVPYACNGFGPGRGFLPDDFPYAKTKLIPLDREHMIGNFAPDIHIPLHPFFGSMGVAPPSAGNLNSGPPWMHAGNMDNKELIAGATVFIPVHAHGALFEAGDGHAGQGNGEVDITALETWLTGTFKFIAHKDQHLLWPRAETPSAYIAMGFHEDLKTATEMAVRNMIDFLVTQKHLSRDDAYALTSVAVDVDITQLVDGKVGVHAICPKGIFTDRNKFSKSSDCVAKLRSDALRSAIQKWKYRPTDQTDCLIRDAYARQRMGDRAALKAVSRELSWTRSAVSKRGAELGVTRVKEKPWSEFESRIVEQFGYLAPSGIQRKLSQAGFVRSVAAIQVKVNRERIKSNLDGYSANQLADALGVEVRKVLRWIQQSFLKAERRGTERIAEQGGDIWWISDRSVRRFVLRFPGEIDLARVEKIWFLNLLTDGQLCARVSY